METMSMIILFFAALAGLFAIVQPLIRRNARGIQAQEELLNQYEYVLGTIRDLDEDFNTGKVSQAVYQKDRDFWTERGVMLLKQIDPDAKIPAKPVKKAQPATTQDKDEKLDAIIEDAIASYRAAKV